MPDAGAYPLEGFRVVDLSQMLAAPGAAMYLADQGPYANQPGYDYLLQAPAPLRHPARLLGQHPREILKELGYSDAAVAAIEEEGVIKQAR